MICMSTSLPISIKLPNRTAGVATPPGTCRVPCAAANDATASITTPMSAICAQRFMVSPFSALLLHLHAVHQRQVKANIRSRGPHEAGADAPGFALNVHAPPFLVDTIMDGKQSSAGKPNIFLKTSENFPFPLLGYFPCR